VHSLVGFGLTSSSLRTFLQSFFAPMRNQFRTILNANSQKKEMKAKNLVTVAAVSAALSFSVTAQAKEEKHEEQSINSSDVPAAVQQAAQAEAKGGSIIRWEKEGANYEAVIQKNGKQIGVEMDANGKVLSKHNEAKEHKEKSENH
jgi:hypothetical protein